MGHRNRRSGAGVLILGLFGPIPSGGLGVAGNTLIFAGFIIAWESIRRFDGKPAANNRVALLILAFLVIFSTAWSLGADIRVRVALVSLAVAALRFSPAARLPSVAGRNLCRVAPPPPSFWGSSVPICCCEPSLPALSPPVSSDLAFFEEPVQGHMVFATTVGLVCLSIAGLSTMARERLLKRYENLALTDELTKLPNRRFFREHGGRLIERAARNGGSACVLIMDLDRFATINERFGHAGGDYALAAFAVLLRQQIRPTDIVARYGGEEFCALLIDTDVMEGERVAERLRAAVAALVVDLRGQAISFTVSVGLAALQGNDLSASLERADQALYRAKRQGRNQVVVAAPECSAP